MSIEHHLDEVLQRFEKVGANLEKLQRIWSSMQSAPDADSYDDLVRAYSEVAAAIPPIDDEGLRATPMSYNEVQLARFEASDVGEPEFYLRVEDEISFPATEFKEYRFRFNAQRRVLVRTRLLDLVAQISGIVDQANASGNIDWDELSALRSELVRLVGDSTPGVARWDEFARHLRFRQPQDLQDIISYDWPSVRGEIQSNLYEDLEPIPVDQTDLSELVQGRPSGPVTTRLRWDVLDDEGFERLMFQLLEETDGYENVTWLMKTKAPDRGRDIQAQRVIRDPLAGTERFRVIVQCKHWLAKSVGKSDLIDLVETVKLWEPPKVDTVVVATSGRFSQDAVAWAERRRHERVVPTPQLWGDSHLETLLARRPHLIASSGLR